MKPERLRSIFFLLLLAGVLTITFFIMQPYLVTLAIAGTAAIIFYPVYKRIVSVLRGRETLAALLMVVLTYVLVLLPLTLLGIQIGLEASNLYTDVRAGNLTFPTEFLQRAEETIRNYIPNISLNAEQYAGQVLNWIAKSLQSLFTQTVQTIFLLFIGTIAYFYMLRDGKKFLSALARISPLTKEEDENLVSRLHNAVNSVVRGSLIIAALQGVVTGIGLLIFGIPSAVLLGSIAGVGAMIPTVGTTIVLVPIVGYLLVTGDYVGGIGLTIWGSVAVGMIDNFLHPLLVGRGMHMHSLFIFFAVIGGIAYFGISGIILGPLVMSLLFGLLDIFKGETKSK